MKDIIDGNKINNEVLFSTTEKINIMFKLLFFSNNLMNFDADSGIKRRLIHFEFKNKFVDKNDFEKEKENHKIGQVFVVDRNLLTKFNTSDDYKNVLIHLLLNRSKNYFEKGLVIPDKYVEISNNACEDNDKFKNFIDNNFDITHVDSDRMQQDEFLEMYNRHSKCNYSWSSVHTNIMRLGIKFNRDARKIINGVSTKRCLIGIKQKEAKYEDEFVEDKKEDNGLDGGIIKDDRAADLEQQLIEERKQHTELKAEYERMKQEFEAYKQQYPQPPPQTKLKVKSAVKFIEDSDEDDSEVDVSENKIVKTIKPKN
jgi:hypothetical protein